ncbi:MAG: aromatic ring-hydroxylating dioxygenase subunit alpha [Tumebacillaceae bacterium]
MRNAWYIAARSEELETGLLACTLFSEELVLYRDAQGEVQALADQCAHRGARLSDGKVIGDCVACPYHGWEYESSGTCRYIPANGRETSVPASAKVRSYPVTEAAGYIWIYMGTPETHRDLELPPELFDETWRGVPFQMEWTAHISRCMESTLDVSHLPFVHEKSTGEVDPTVDGPAFEVRENEIIIEAKPYHPLVATPLNEEEAKGVSTIQLLFPNLLMLRTDMFHEKKMATFLALTPVDEEQIRIYGLALRNFFTDIEMVDEIHYEHNVTVLEEDRRIVEGLRPFKSPLELHREVHVRSDAPQIRYRRMILKAMQDDPDFEY